ncbi:MAG TPA: glycosyltransferase 87 family protein, partial [Gemmataceae bacterium]|nr:glycosyltransferase 87 family protein [Gemmataceae bacterium]
MPACATYVLQSLLTGALVLGACHLALPASKTNGEDWVQDYLSARALLRGEDPYQDLPAMRAAAGVPSSATDPVPVNPHPPGAFLWLLPLGALDYPASFLALRLLNGLALGLAWNGAWRVFARPAERTRWLLAAAGGAFGFWGPVYQGFDFGQPSGLLALAVLGLWVALRGDGPFRKGLALGLACTVRPFFFILSAAGMAGGVRPVGLSVAGFAVGFGLPFLVVG